MGGSVHTEAHETRGEQLDGGVHSTGALFESKVGVIENSQTDETDNTIDSPDKEGGPEPVAGPEDGRESSITRWPTPHLLSLCGVEVTTEEEETKMLLSATDPTRAGNARTKP